MLLSLFFCSGLHAQNYYHLTGNAGFSESTRGKKIQPLAANSILNDSSDCARMKMWEFYPKASQDDAKKQRDTLKLFIEKCAVSDPTSYQAFPSLSDAVGYYNPKDQTRFDEFRSWLISVLYLNTTNPAYFCSCMGAIATTYQVGKYYPLGALAVLNYVRTFHRECWGAGNDRAFTNDSIDDFQSGYDPTHLPSLDSLGLGILLHNNGVVSPSQPLPSVYLSSFTSNPNPFIKETTLEFTLNRMAYVQVAVYDELGKLVWGDGRGSSLEACTHQIHLDGSAFPSGVFYARISTGFGEVKTLKLVKEK